jgi:hypothetical protein
MTSPSVWTLALAQTGAAAARPGNGAIISDIIR